jgi:hypothetical protein
MRTAAPATPSATSAEMIQKRRDRPRRRGTARASTTPTLVALLTNANGCDGEGRNRTGDTTVFSRVLYQLSYLAAGRLV